MRGRTRLFVALTIVLLPGFILAPVWPLAGLGAGEDDILYYLPSRTFFHDCIQSGHAPWLNPWTGLGRPFLADPQSAVLYPFTWLFALLSPLVAYPLSLWLHYSLAMWGMYRLLRADAPWRRAGEADGKSGANGGRTAEGGRAINSAAPVFREVAETGGLSPLAALFGAVAFGFCGFMLAHRAHFAIQNAAAWTPWLFWRMRRYAEDGGGRRLAAAAACATMQALAGHVQVAAICALGTLVYVLVAPGAGSMAHRVEDPSLALRAPLTLWARIPSLALRALLALRARMAWRWVAVWTCAGGLLAAQWLPTVLYLQDCTRSHRPFWMFVENSWHPASLLNLVLPMFFGQRTPNIFDAAYWGSSHQVEQFSYGGILPLVLAAAAVLNGWRDQRRRRAWIILAGFAVLLALGKYGPVCPILYWIPGSSVFRVPARGMLLFDLAIAAIGAGAVHDLIGALSPLRARLRERLLRWTRQPALSALALIGAALGALLIIFLIVSPLLNAETRGAAWRALRPWNPAILTPLAVAVLSFAALRAMLRRWPDGRAATVLIFALIVDLSVIGWTIDVPANVHSAAEFLSAPQRDEWLAVRRSSSNATETERGLVRAYGPRTWTITRRVGERPGEYFQPLDRGVANTNILANFPVLTDYGPLQPQSVVERFGFTVWGETDRTPSGPDGRSMLDHLLADTSWLRPYNVGWILICDANLPGPAECELALTTRDGLRMYRGSGAGGAVLFADAKQSGSARLAARSPYDLEVAIDTTTDERGGVVRLIISALALPGWHATLDGAPVSIEAFDQNLIAVNVPRGRASQLHLEYFPPGLLVGAWISLGSGICLILLAIRGHRRGLAALHAL